MRAKYQDNLENMQWFKSFYEKNYTGQLYDPIVRRTKGKGADQTTAFALSSAKRGPSHTEPSTEENTAPSSGSTQRPTKTASSTTTSNTTAVTTNKRMSTGGSTTAPSTANPGPKPSSSATTVNASSGLSNSGVRTNSNVVTSPAHHSSTSSQQIENYKHKINELTQMNNDLTLSVESLEKERDWYFSKLRDIEIMLQTYSGTDKKTVDGIFKILYATDDEFVTLDENNTNSSNNHLPNEQNTSQHSETVSPTKPISLEG